MNTTDNTCQCRCQCQSAESFLLAVEMTEGEGCDA